VHSGRIVGSGGLADLRRLQRLSIPPRPTTRSHHRHPSLCVSSRDADCAAPSRRSTHELLTHRHRRHRTLESRPPTLRRCSAFTTGRVMT
jgi:hypothetical protein